MKVYLDNNATTPPDPRVVEAMLPALRGLFGNPASATHAWGWQAEELVNIAREQVALSVGCSPRDLIFTSGATESLALAIRGMAHLTPRRVLISSIEHKAVIDNANALLENGFEVEEVPVLRDGLLDLARLEKALERPALLVAVIGGNNEIGTIQELRAVREITRKRGALVLLDAVQLLGKEVVDVSTLQPDLAAFSAHKIYGPKGVGALYIREDLASQISPLIRGGGHERDLRSGTLNVPGIVGFGKAAEIVRSEHERYVPAVQKLTGDLLERLRRGIPGIALNGHSSRRIAGNLSLTLPKVRGDRIFAKLSSSVALSATSACVSGSKGGSHVLAAIGMSMDEQYRTIRIGVGRFNTEEEIAFAAERICEAYADLAAQAD